MTRQEIACADEAWSGDETEAGGSGAPEQTQARERGAGGHCESGMVPTPHPPKQTQAGGPGDTVSQAWVPASHRPPQHHPA